MSLKQSLMNGSPILRPQDAVVGQFRIDRDLNGNFVFTVCDKWAKLSPAQTFDLARRLLGALGIELQKVEEQGAALPGPRLDG